MSENPTGSEANRQGLASSNLPVPDGYALQALPRPTEANVNEDAGGQPRSDSSEGGTSDAQAAFSAHVHQYIREYIQLADQKAMFFFAGSTALLAFLFQAGISARWLKPIMDWNPLDLTAFVAMVALGLSALTAIAVVIPRTRGSLRGHVFWEAIAEFSSARDYADDVARMTSATLSQIQAEHCFDLASVCRRKYSTLRLALWIGAVGLLATIIVLLFVPSPSSTVLH